MFFDFIRIMKRYISTNKPLVIVFLAFLAVSLFVRQDKLSDDAFFNAARYKYGLIDFLEMRYETWTTRSLAETILYGITALNIIVWQLLNAVSWTLLTYSIATILDKDYKKNIRNVVVFLLTINAAILASAGFQLTGSINYVLPLAVAMYALSPLLAGIYRGSLAESIPPVRIVLMLLTVFINEQVALVCFMITGTIMLMRALLSRRVDRMLLLAVVALGSLLALISQSEGNSIRLTTEVQNWYPNFYDIGLLGRLKVFFIWLFTSLFIKLSIFMLVVSLAAFIKIIKSKKSTILGYAQACYLIVPVAVAFINTGYASDTSTKLERMIYSFDFLGVYSGEKIRLPIYSEGILLTCLSYGYWLVFVYIIVKSFQKELFTKYSLVVFGALSASAGVFILSPTIFASGNRILLVPAVLLLLIFMPVFMDMDKRTKLVAATLALINVLNILLIWLGAGYMSIY